MKILMNGILYAKNCNKSGSHHTKEIRFDILRDILFISIQRNNLLLSNQNNIKINYEEF